MKKTIIIGIYLSLCCSLTACGNSKDIAEYDIDSVLSNEVTYDEYVSEKTDGMISEEAVQDDNTIDELVLDEELTRIVNEIGLENAYPWNNTAEFKDDADIIIKLASDDSGRYEIYGIKSQKYGDYGLLLNDRVNGEDNWNFEYLPWYYSGAPSDEPILEPYEDKFIFSYVYKYDDGVPMRKEATVDCGYDTGHMELDFEN